MLGGEDAAVIERASHKLQQCLDDSSLIDRCRETAERIYTKGYGVAGYQAMYAAITGPEDQRH